MTRFGKPTDIPNIAFALPPSTITLRQPSKNAVPSDLEQVAFEINCFWNRERVFCQLDDVL